MKTETGEAAASAALAWPEGAAAFLSLNDSGGGLAGGGVSSMGVGESQAMTPFPSQPMVAAAALGRKETSQGLAVAAAPPTIWQWPGYNLDGSGVFWLGVVTAYIVMCGGGGNDGATSLFWLTS